MYLSFDSSGLGVSGYTGMFDFRLPLDFRVIDAEGPWFRAAICGVEPTDLSSSICPPDMGRPIPACSRRGSSHRARRCG